MSPPDNTGKPPARVPARRATVDDLDKFDALIDTRSPAEFADDHIPGAINLPVLGDEERARVGTLYTQESPFEARKLGAALVSRNIARHLEGPLAGHAKKWKPLVYCWRGGQRSGAMTIVLTQIGWSARQLDGGYRAFRRRVIADLEALPAASRFIVLHGPTGSGKTALLAALRAAGAQEPPPRARSRGRSPLKPASGTRCAALTPRGRSTWSPRAGASAA